MAFHLTVAGSLEPLADHLAAVLATPLPDPFTPELVAVPGGGVQAWLTARLARRLGTSGSGAPDGIVANVEFVFPATIVARALGEASGVGRWSTGPLTWAVHAVLQEVGEELGQPTDAVRARVVADLFDRYTLYRPEMARAWSEGRDVDGAGAPLEAHHRWQPALWRAVQAHLGGPTDAQRTEELARALEAGDGPGPAPELPDRVCLFGLASLPPAHLRLLGALAHHLEVHVLAPASSEARWRRAAEALEDGQLRLPVRRGGEEEEALAVGGGHPLVSSWGRASREANVLLVDRANGLDDATVHGPGPAPELASGAPLLARLQHGIRADEAPPVRDGPEVDRRPLFDPAVDPSVRWHRAHGPGRQVEVLRDALLHLFEELDPDGRPRFEPRDVAVLCPDPSAFAPLVEATFAGDPDHGVPAVPVRVADRSLRQDNPLLDAAAAVLDLLDGRFRASSVLAFAARPPVRHRFGLDGAALTRISEWAEATNVRWGLGPADHHRFGLPADLAVHTWRAGLDQLLLGAAMAPDGARLGPGEVAPFATIEGDDVAIAGALAELVDRLEAALGSLRATTTVEAWCDALAVALRELCAVPDAEAWQWRAVERTLDQLREEATVDGQPRATTVDPFDLATLVRARLSGSGGRPRFGTGAVTVSSLTAQRGVPHRVVCLLGLDADAASGGLAVEDLLAARPCVGDRDPRSEQRAQLLDAVLAAGERLWLFSTGHDLRSSAELPPIVPVAELMEVVDATVRPSEGRPSASRALTVDHPRQPWAESVLVPAGLGTAAPGPWSFDRGALRAAEARRAQSVADTRLLPEPLAPPEGDHRGPGGAEVVELGQLVTAVTNPARLLLAGRLGLALPEVDEVRADTIPLQMGPLEEWQVIDRLLAVHLSTHPDALEEAERAWELVERRRGAVPPLCFGDRPVSEARRRIDAFDAELSGVFGATVRDPRPVAVSARATRLDDGAPIVVEGTVEGVCDDTVLTVTASRFKPRDWLVAWVRVAALTAHDPSRPWRAVTIARDGDRGDKAAVKVVEVALLDPGEAAGVLALVDDLRRRALADVVPAFPATTHAWWCKGPSAARTEWESRFGEATDKWMSTAVGEDFDAVLDLPLRPDEGGGAATDRVGWWAERLWGAFEATTGSTLRTVALEEAAP